MAGYIAWLEVGDIYYPLHPLDRKSIMQLRGDPPLSKGFPAYVYYEQGGDCIVYPHPSEWLLDNFLFIQNKHMTKIPLRNCL